MPAVLTRKPKTLIKPELRTLADVLHSLGGIPASRIRTTPAPGTATEDDALRVTETERPR